MAELPESNKQRAQVIPKSWPLLSLLFTLIVIAILVSGIICHVTSTSCGAYNKAFYVILPIAYFVYIIECCISYSRQHLSNNMKVTEFESFMKKMKAARPSIGIRIECHHNETNKRTVRTKDSNGNDISYEETYTEKVTTFRGSSLFDYERFEDMTGEVVMEEGLIKLEVQKMYMFDCEESKRKFERHNNDYINENKSRDTCLDSFLIFELPGEQPKVLVGNRGTKSPCFLGIGWYLICSIFLLSWPYRMWFEGITKARRITLNKVVYA